MLRNQETTETIPRHPTEEVEVEAGPFRNDPLVEVFNQDKARSVRLTHLQPKVVQASEQALDQLLLHKWE